MARIARNDLIFNAFCRERRGEADSGLRFGFLLCSDFSALFFQIVFGLSLGRSRDVLNNFGKNCFLGLARKNNLGI